MNKKLLRYTVVGLSILLPALSGEAAPIVASGSYGGFSWYGGTLIIGQTSTATAAGGGDPRYFAPMPQYSGVAALILNFASGDSFICSGSLLSASQLAAPPMTRSLRSSQRRGPWCYPSACRKASERIRRWSIRYPERFTGRSF